MVNIVIKKTEDIDKLALDNLEKKLGFSIEPNRTVNFYFYFPEEHQAYEAAALLANLHFDTQISCTEYSEQWLCLATKEISMTGERLLDLRSWMEDLASKMAANTTAGKRW